MRSIGRIGTMARRAMTRRRLTLGLAALASGFLATSFVSPLLEQLGLPGAGPTYLLFTPICHQLPERCLAIGNAHQALCARCTGLYLGGVLALLAAFCARGGLRRPPRSWLFFAAAPSVVDALLAWSGLPSLSNVPRLCLALPAGAMAGWFLALALAELAGEGAGRPGLGAGEDNRTIRAMEEAHG